MKTKEELTELLENSGYPSAFLFFESEQIPPYSILVMDSSANIHSDTEMVQPVDTFTIEFYYRNPKDRFEFEKFLTDHLIWQRYSTDVPIGQNGVLMSSYEPVY